MELVRYSETRFASKILMLKRYMNLLKVLKRLVIDDVYTGWLLAEQTTARREGQGTRAYKSSAPFEMKTSRKPPAYA
eukprot:scaffold230634_cov36-Tisochrysis_lutea.AAC.3